VVVAADDVEGEEEERGRNCDYYHHQIQSGLASYLEEKVPRRMKRKMTMDQRDQVVHRWEERPTSWLQSTYEWST